MIHDTYSDHSPLVQRLQGGILYPHNIEQVEVTSEEGTITQYRYKLLKFKDDGQSLSDTNTFAKQNISPIRAQADGPVDVQAETPRHPDWMNKAADKISGEVVKLESELTEDERLDLLGYYDSWQSGVDYIVDQVLEYNGGLFKVLQAHTSQSDWTPDTATSLFTEVVPPSVIPVWEQPEGSHDAYAKGDKVEWPADSGTIWQSDIDDNVWEPGEYGWTET